MRFDERNGSSVVERAFMLLQAFELGGPEIGLAELSRRAKLPKATTYRLANQLVSLGALERRGDVYRLGLRMFELGSNVARQRRLRDAALPFMQDLYEATHETIHLGVLDGLSVLYIEKIVGHRGCPVPTQIAAHNPLHCTALGKVILAHSDAHLVEAVVEAGLVRQSRYTIIYPRTFAIELKKIRELGVAYDSEEYKVGVSCVAAPILDRNRRARAAISITWPTGRLKADRSLAPLRSAARGLAKTLDGNPWPA